MNSRNNKHLLPFLHIREGAGREEIREILTGLKNDGIECFVNEAQSGEYMGWAYWKDMDILIEELEELGMSFYIQDEQVFPTGSANGWVKRRHPELAKRFLDLREIDAFGPLQGASFNIGAWMDPNNQQDMLQTILNAPVYRENGSVAQMFREMIHWLPNELIAVVVCRKDPETGALIGECIDVTDKVVDGWLYWDVPEGLWEVIILFKTYRSTGRPGYINMIDRDSVKLLIEALYEPMYDRYARYFGNVFKGFFTDEPEFGNRSGYGSQYYENTGIGHEWVPVPWCDELQEMLEERFGPDYVKHLPTLWFDRGADRNAQDRYIYMDMITRLYEKNFAGQIGEWCMAHGCEYTGHVVEDAGCHARLGAGAGHYFRAIHGETIGGIDIVENQLIAGFDHVSYRWTLGVGDGEEFTYLLAKMGSSAAHIDPKKKGRVLCETFAAYEKVQGIQSLKWVCDQLLSRGINEIMPNYNKTILGVGPNGAGIGLINPGSEGLPILTQYVTRICTLLSGGVHSAPVAVLYHAESEWAGEYMNSAKPIHHLAMRQIDCDVLPVDVITRPDEYRTYADSEGLHVNQEVYRALVIPYCRYLAAPVAEWIAMAQSPVIFVDALPDGIVGGNSKEAESFSVFMNRLHAVGKYRVVGLNDLADVLITENIADIRTSVPTFGLRYYRYLCPDKEIYLFFNEYPYTPVDTEITLPTDKPLALYDAMDDRFYNAEAECSDGNGRFSLHLEPGETILVFAGETDFPEVQPKPPVLTEDHTGRIIQPEGWTLRACDAEKDPAEVPAVRLQELKNLAGPESYQVSRHIFRYEAPFTVEAKQNERIWLDLGRVYETARLKINGSDAGMRICAPYRFDITELVKTGENTIEADIWGTYRSTDSQRSVFKPLGLLGPVRVHLAVQD